jgi:hypothetical protein
MENKMNNGKEYFDGNTKDRKRVFNANLLDLIKKEAA